MKITSITARWLHVPIPYEQQHVSDFGRIGSFDSVLVRVEADNGLTGYGEAKEEVGSEANCHTLVAAINQKFGPMLIGEDPRDTSRLWELMYNGVRGHYALAHGHVFPILGRRGVSISAISGIDMALWDLVGKWLGQPVWRLLGGRKGTHMPAYASGGWAGADKIGEQLASYVSRGGFKAVKMRVGVIDGDPVHSAKRVRAARDFLGPDIAIACDAHGTYTVAEAMRIGAIAAAFNLKLAPHLWTGALAFAAGMHVATASPAGFILEYSLGANPLLHELSEEKFSVKDGMVEIPDRPGLGVTVNDAFVKRYTVD